MKLFAPFCRSLSRRPLLRSQRSRRSTSRISASARGAVTYTDRNGIVLGTVLGARLARTRSASRSASVAGPVSQRDRRRRRRALLASRRRRRARAGPRGARLRDLRRSAQRRLDDRDAAGAAAARRAQLRSAASSRRSRSRERIAIALEQERDPRGLRQPRADGRQPLRRRGRRAHLLRRAGERPGSRAGVAARGDSQRSGRGSRPMPTGRRCARASTSCCGAWSRSARSRPQRAAQRVCARRSRMRRHDSASPTRAHALFLSLPRSPPAARPRAHDARPATCSASFRRRRRTCSARCSRYHVDRRRRAGRRQPHRRRARLRRFARLLLRSRRSGATTACRRCASRVRRSNRLRYELALERGTIRSTTILADVPASYAHPRRPALPARRLQRPLQRAGARALRTRQLAQRPGGARALAISASATLARSVCTRWASRISTRPRRTTGSA